MLQFYDVEPGLLRFTGIQTPNRDSLALVLPVKVQECNARPCFSSRVAVTASTLGPSQEEEIIHSSLLLWSTPWFRIIQCNPFPHLAEEHLKHGLLTLSHSLSLLVNSALPPKRSENLFGVNFCWHLPLPNRPPSGAPFLLFNPFLFYRFSSIEWKKRWPLTHLFCSLAPVSHLISSYFSFLSTTPRSHGPFCLPSGFRACADHLAARLIGLLHMQLFQLHRPLYTVPHGISCKHVFFWEVNCLWSS